jgi:hypothetical protein
MLAKVTYIVGEQHWFKQIHDIIGADKITDPSDRPTTAEASPKSRHTNCQDFSDASAVLGCGPRGLPFPT